jgi:single-strand DNA-binding protein
MKVEFYGNLGRDVELRYTGTGNPVSHFSVAESFGKDDKKTTEWWSVTAWGPLAEEVSKTLSKGSRVHVTGKLAPRTYTDPKTNEQRKTFEITADAVTLEASRGNAEMPF